MPFGYIGQNQTKQQVKNSGVLSSFDISLLEKKGEAGGSLELIAEQTVSGVANLSMTTIKENVYDTHLLEVIGYNPVSSDRLGMQFFESGTRESASVYQFGYQYGYYSGGFGENKSTGANHIKICPDEGTDSTDSSNAYCYIYNAGNSNKKTFTTNQMVGTDFIRYGGGVLPQNSIVDGIYLFGDLSGSNFSLTAKLYGVKQ
jgi:hypothetical protein